MFSSVQFRVVSVRSGKLICAPLRPPTLPLKQFQCLYYWRWPSLVLSVKIVKRFLFPRPSPPGDRRRDVLGFVHTDSVSSFSTLQVFRDTNDLWGWLRCPPVISLIHSGMSRAVHHPPEFSKADVDHLHIPVWTSYSRKSLLSSDQSAFCMQMMSWYFSLQCVSPSVKPRKVVSSEVSYWIAFNEDMPRTMVGRDRKL